MTSDFIGTVEVVVCRELLLVSQKLRYRHTSIEQARPSRAIPGAVREPRSYARCRWLASEPWYVLSSVLCRRCSEPCVGCFNQVLANFGPGAGARQGRLCGKLGLGVAMRSTAVNR